MNDNLSTGRTRQLRELSLFTGSGGGVLGTTLLGWRHIGYVEFDSDCQQALRARIVEGSLDNAPIFGDVRDFISEGHAETYAGHVDVLSAGFPCQPFSTAGKREGIDDSRNMWPATIECIRLVRPRIVFLENVPGLLSSGYFGTILGDLAESGYDTRWRILSAAEVGAPHLRKRLWIVGYSQELRWDEIQPARPGKDQRYTVTARGSGIKMAYTIRQRSTEAGELRHDGPQERTSCGGEAITIPHTDGPLEGRGEQSQRGQAWRDPQLARDGEGRKMADADQTRCLEQRVTQPTAQEEPSTECRGEMANTDIGGCEPQGSGLRTGEQAQQRGGRSEYGDQQNGPSWWEVEPGMGRVVDGMANRVVRLKALGNGQVPLCAAVAFYLLAGDYIADAETYPE